jgi:NAD(P)-dependent dehydrogenase (short-subunit alcohol dehydrogenase family)
MKSMQKKTVVITGASSGIGRASVSQLAKAGWHVFATVRKTEDADRLRTEFGEDVTPVIMDVTDRTSITAAAAQVSAHLKGQGLGGLVNVAGIGMVRPVEFATPEDMQTIFDINVIGQVLVTQALLPALRQARGRIVNISSVGAHIPIPFGGLLNASKGAFGLLSDTLRLELRPFGIRVITVEPGAIKTPAVEKTLGDVDAVIGKLPPRGVALYGDNLKKFAGRAYHREMEGSAPEVVGEVVHKALTVDHPRTRYVVGKHAKLLVSLPKLLPDELLDSAVLRITGLSTKSFA